MELTSLKPRSLPLIQNVQIESKCIQFRDPKRKRSVGYLIEMQLRRLVILSPLHLGAPGRGSQAEAASAHWMSRFGQPATPSAASVSLVRSD